MPSTEEVLLEFELAHSTPERVFEWLKARAEIAYDESFLGGEEVEETLLSRRSNLINLGLARYGYSSCIVRKLFSGGNAPDGELLDSRSDRTVPGIAHALRLAALSNRTLVKRGLSEKMPIVLFSADSWNSDVELIREFVTAAGADEVYAMFRNPTIHGDILARLYAKESPFDVLSDERWQLLITATIGNPRLREEYDGPMDGWGEYMHGRVFDKAWALTERVPVTDSWANILVRLLKEVSPVYSKEGKMAVIQRWHVGTRNETAELPESFSDGYLDDFGTLRAFLVSLLRSSELEGLKSHEDVAVRCGFYEHGNPTREELLEAHAREPKLLLNHALRNDTVWMRKETRETLRSLCWADKSDDTLWFPNSYQEHENRLEAEHPEWFTEDQDESVRKRQFDLEEGLRAVQASQSDILNRLVDMRAGMKIVFGLICFVLAAIVFRKW